MSTPTSVTLPHSAGDSKGVRLPKLDAPTFNGSILSWRSFWEQFTISVHDRSSLSNSEKLVHLQQSLKGGSAKSSIKGLPHTGRKPSSASKQGTIAPDWFTNAREDDFGCSTHWRMVATGREICKLHDTVLQHLRALKSMGYESSGPFITSALTMFEWQKHSQNSEGVPHYQDLLDFLIFVLRQLSPPLLIVTRNRSMIPHSRRRVMLWEEWWPHTLLILICLPVNVFYVNPVLTSIRCTLVHSSKRCLMRQGLLLLSRTACVWIALLLITL